MYLRHVNAASWKQRLQKFGKLLPPEWNAGTVNQIARYEVVERIIDDMTTPQRQALMAAIVEDNKPHLSGFYRTICANWLPESMQERFLCDRITSLPLSQLATRPSNNQNGVIVRTVDPTPVSRLSFTGTADLELAMPGPGDTKGTRVKRGHVIHQVDRWVSTDVRKSASGIMEFKDYELLLQLYTAVQTHMAYQGVFFHDTSIGSFEPAALYLRVGACCLEDALFWRYMTVRCREYVPTVFTPDVNIWNCGNFKFSADWVAKALKGPVSLPTRIGSDRFVLDNSLDKDLLCTGAPVPLFEDIRAHLHTVFFEAMKPEVRGGWEALEQELAEVIGETPTSQVHKEMVTPLLSSGESIMLPADAVLTDGRLTVYVGTTMEDEAGIRGSPDLYGAHDIIWGPEGFHYAWGGVISQGDAATLRSNANIGDIVYSGEKTSYLVQQLSPTIGTVTKRTSESIKNGSVDGFPKAPVSNLRPNGVTADGATIVFIGDSGGTLTADQAAKRYADVVIRGSFGDSPANIREQLEKRFLKWASASNNITFTTQPSRSSTYATFASPQPTESAREEASSSGEGDQP